MQSRGELMSSYIAHQSQPVAPESDVAEGAQEVPALRVGLLIADRVDGVGFSGLLTQSRRAFGQRRSAAIGGVAASVVLVGTLLLTGLDRAEAAVDVVPEVFPAEFAPEVKAFLQPGEWTPHRPSHGRTNLPVDSQWADGA